MENLYNIFYKDHGLLPEAFGVIFVILAFTYLSKQDKAPVGIGKIRDSFIAFFLAKLTIISSYFLLDINEIVVFLEILFLGISFTFFVSGGLAVKGSRTPYFITIFLFILTSAWSANITLLNKNEVMIVLTKYIFPGLSYLVLSICFLTKKVQSHKSGFRFFGLFSLMAAIYYLGQIITIMTFVQGLWFFMPLLFIGFIASVMLIANDLLKQECEEYKEEIEVVKDRLKLIIQSSPFPITISRLKDDQLIFINKNAADLFGINPEQPNSYRMVDFFADHSNRQELLNKLNANKVVEDFEVLVKSRTSGKPFWLLLSARVIDFDLSVALYCAFQDITNRKNKEIELFDQATKDPLTGAYNRRQFEEMVKKEFYRNRRYGGSFCIIMVDADHFKNVNDTYGHQTGDSVLKALSKSFFDTLRETDAVFRFGGEEFVLLLPEISLENAYSVAERLRIIISELEVLAEDNKTIVKFTVSMGVVESSQASEPEMLVKLSDEALYEAKETGRNQVIISKAPRDNAQMVTDSVDSIPVTINYNDEDELPIDDDLAPEGKNVGRIKLEEKAFIQKIHSEKAKELQEDSLEDDLGETVDQDLPLDDLGDENISETEDVGIENEAVEEQEYEAGYEEEYEEEPPLNEEYTVEEPDNSTLEYSSELETALDFDDDFEDVSEDVQEEVAEEVLDDLDEMPSSPFETTVEDQDEQIAYKNSIDDDFPLEPDEDDYSALDAPPPPPAFEMSQDFDEQVDNETLAENSIAALVGDEQEFVEDEIPEPNLEVELDSNAQAGDDFLEENNEPFVEAPENNFEEEEINNVVEPVPPAVTPKPVTQAVKTPTVSPSVPNLTNKQPAVHPVKAPVTSGGAPVKKVVVKKVIKKIVKVVKRPVATAPNVPPKKP